VSEANNLSPETPWPGLKSYNEDDQEFFCGRDAEIQELLWLVRRNVVTVLFGPSGTGKSSLVQSGLFPALRKESFAPFRIRLKHGGDLIKQVQRDLGLTGESLWEGFHRVGVEGQAEPVVVFDQFEEIFTLGDGRPESERFLEELADLVENYYPRTVRERLEKGEHLNFSPDRQAYHLVLVLREDFVWRLDGFRTRMPAIMRERFILKPFTEDKALEAVEKPGNRILDNEVARKIVAFAVSSRGPRVVDPPILSLLCRELNQRRRRGAKMSADQLEGDSETILSKFWDDSIAALDETSRQPVREFIEDRLVSPNGFRTAWPSKELTPYAAAVDKLIDGRVLRSEERFGSPHLELTHDVLTGVVRRSRDERRLREEREAERMRADAEKRRADLERQHAQESAQQASRLRRYVSALVIALLAAIGFCVFAFVERSNAEAQRAETERQRANALYMQIEGDRRAAAMQWYRDQLTIYRRQNR
jgi:hypothetical protein